ncbi:hypothetical protein Tco_1019898 [Tanacetum coccineum]|uniref:Uncharacterized protein n=1 Tax=Tanacetum coccineum TaxID=301880 RepID=A0ABQ5FZS2_9ASTR
MFARGEEYKGQEGEDASKQGRNKIDQDEGISWFQEDAETQGRYGHDISTAEVTIASVPSDVDVSDASPIRPVDDSITDDITLAKTLVKIKSSASRSQKDKGFMFKEPSEPTTTSRPQSHIPAKDKGKGIMQEPEKQVKMKGKDQIEYDADVAQRLRAELDEEARLEREREEETEEQGEISIEERSRLFVELVDKRKKHFAKLKAKEQTRKPPTKTQKRNIMSTYLKNMAGYKHTQLKKKSFKEIQMLFEKEMKRVNIFVDMDAELVKGRETREESGSKRAGDELEQESSKRQKVDDDDKEREDLKQCFKIIPYEEFIVHVIPLAAKPTPIIGFQIHRAGRKGSYKIIRANGSTKTYTLFSQLIKEFDREDLENLWKLVKTKHRVLKGLLLHRSSINNSASLNNKFRGFYFIFKFGIPGLLHHVVKSIADRIRVVPEQVETLKIQAGVQVSRPEDTEVIFSIGSTLEDFILFRKKSRPWKEAFDKRFELEFYRKMEGFVFAPL